MKKKGYIAIGLMLVLFGSVLSPLTIAKETTEKQTSIIELFTYDENGGIVSQVFQITQNELTEMRTLLTELSEKIEKVTDQSQIDSVIDGFLRSGRLIKHPILALCLLSLVKRGNLGNRGLLSSLSTVNKLNPLNKFSSLGKLSSLTARKTFVLSYGSCYELRLFTQDKQVQLSKPLELWHYRGTQSIIPHSKTVIVEGSPFHVKVLTGRQIGFMRGFTGIYIRMHCGLTDVTHTFFLGRAAAVRGMDFSLFNILK